MGRALRKPRASDLRSWLSLCLVACVGSVLVWSALRCSLVWPRVEAALGINRVMTFGARSIDDLVKWPLDWSSLAPSASNDALLVNDDVRARAALVRTTGPVAWAMPETAVEWATLIGGIGISTVAALAGLGAGARVAGLSLHRVLDPGPVRLACSPRWAAIHMLGTLTLVPPANVVIELPGLAQGSFDGLGWSVPGAATLVMLNTLWAAACGVLAVATPHSPRLASATVCPSCGYTLAAGPCPECAWGVNPAVGRGRLALLILGLDVALVIVLARGLAQASEHGWRASAALLGLGADQTFPGRVARLVVAPGFAYRLAGESGEFLVVCGDEQSVGQGVPLGVRAFARPANGPWTPLGEPRSWGPSGSLAPGLPAGITAVEIGTANGLPVLMLTPFPNRFERTLLDVAGEWKPTGLPG